MNTLKKIINASLVSMIMISSMFVLGPMKVHAQATPPPTNPAVDAACDGIALTGSNCNGPGARGQINDLIKDVVNILSVIIGVIAVVMIMIGGLKYIMSNGDPAQTATAKNTILYAIVGLVVVAMAQIIVKFVLTKVNTAIT